MRASGCVWLRVVEAWKMEFPRILNDVNAALEEMTLVCAATTERVRRKFATTTTSSCLDSHAVVLGGQRIESGEQLVQHQHQLFCRVLGREVRESADVGEQNAERTLDE